MLIGTIISGFPWSGNPGAVRPKPLYVSSTTGMVVGDSIKIMLDNGEMFTTTIATIQVQNGITISNKLPHNASAGNIVVDLTQATIVAPSRAELDTDING